MTRAIVIAAVVACFAASPARAEQEEVAQRGKEIYMAYCGPCHGTTGKGDGEMARFLRGRPADLTLLSQKNGGQFPFWRVFAIIEGKEYIGQHGSREMPIWGTWFAGEQGSTDPAAWIDLTRGRIWQLIVYLESIQAK
jgi:mono/diheme cytochrome c family protein